MIKLIASDMDGTLLRDDKSINDEIFYLIEKLYKKGIVFVAASGRQYPSLRKTFDCVKDKVVFVAENGTYVLDNETEIYSSILDKSMVRDIVDYTRTLDGVRPILGCKNHTYTEDQRIYDHMGGEIFNYNMKLIDDVRLVEEDVLKVAMVDKGDVYSNCFDVVYAKFKDEFEVAVSGRNFIDLTKKNENKGNAIKILQDRFGISSEQCVAFGDNYNDLRMLEQVHYSFAMENAPDRIKKASRFIAPCNNEDGVIKKIKELVFDK